MYSLISQTHKRGSTRIKNKTTTMAKKRFWRRKHTRNETLAMVWEFTVTAVRSWFNQGPAGAYEQTRLYRMLRLRNNN